MNPCSAIVAGPSSFKPDSGVCLLCGLHFDWVYSYRGLRVGGAKPEPMFRGSCGPRSRLNSQF